jgi:isoleucyl-tRNA synthetase
MDFAAEGTIVSELLKFAENGNLYRGSKPVMWSPVEQTALAEAEVEYEDLTDSPQIDVAFKITKSSLEDLIGAYAVIWTTTPWTIPVNQALAYSTQINYVLLRHEESNRSFLIAEALQSEWENRVALKGLKKTGPLIKGSQLAGSFAQHPMHHLGGFYGNPRPLLAGDFVTTATGTGLVHMSPDHGEDDFALCKEHGIEPVFAVMDDGRYRDDWLWLGAADLDQQGKARRRAVINKPFNAPEGPICSDLRKVGALLSATADYAHSYPHSWRSKAKVIYRCTPQWFVPMDKIMSWQGQNDGPGQKSRSTLRERASSEISRVRFIPEKGRNRIGAMVETRPDWVLSRQRAWGVPITLFVNRKTGDYLRDKEVNQRIIAAVNEVGVDAWDPVNAQEFLGSQYQAADFEMITDILDVWFDSGCTHSFVLEGERWSDLKWPADLYLEGSDQHRGWFQSSLLQSCATRGRAPYDQVLTHGFTMDAKGKKMSKSLGNTIDPLKLMEKYGADIIRLWALSVDFTEDHRIGEEILKGVGDQYRKLRNTFRYLLGALEGYDGGASRLEQLPELEGYILTLLKDLDGKLLQAIADYDFNAYTRLLVDFCNEDLSAFFFDIRKDRLYCDDPEDEERIAYRAVLDVLFHALVRYAAPVLVYTSEEVWKSRFPDRESVHLQEWPELPQVSPNELGWDKLRELREQVNEAIEPLRREKVIRSSLEAEVVIPQKLIPKGFTNEDLSELFITASVERNEGDGVIIKKASHNKCGRCWRLMPEIEEDGDLCLRCEDVVVRMDAA